MSEEISVLLLAAGASVRMGDNIKQLLPWGNSTLLGHALQQANQISDDVWIVLGANEEVIKKSLPPDTKTIFNPDWSLGIGTSIAAGVKQLLQSDDRGRPLLIMLADQPFLDSDFLSQLKKEFNENPYKIVATDYRNKLGVPAIFHPSMLPELTNLNKDFGARKVIQKYRANAGKVLPKGKEIDIDTMEAYRRLFRKTHL